MHRYENEERATLLSMKFDNKEDGTYKADLRAEVGGESSLGETDETVPTSGSGSKTSFEKNYQWIIKATPEKASNDKDTFMVSEIGLKLISFLNKVYSFNQHVKNCSLDCVTFTHKLVSFRVPSAGKGS